MKKIGALFVCLLVLLGACSSGSEVTEIPGLPVEASYPNSGNKQTVLVYIVGNNSLSSFAGQNIEGMISGLETAYGLDGFDAKNCNLLFFISDRKDGSAIYQTVSDGYYIDKNGVKKRKYKRVLKYPDPMLIKVDVDKGVVKEYIVQRYKDADALDPSFMAEVMDDAFNREFKAESNGLILWSHADGWLPIGTPRKNTRWFGQDGAKFMDLMDLKSSLSRAPHLDFILYDCCFMQGIEVAYELKEYADYFIGSPTEIPGPGAPYDKLTALFYNSSDMSSDVLARSVADTYFDYYKNPRDDWAYGASISLIDASKLDLLAAKTKEILIDRSSISHQGVMYYDRSTISYYFDMADLLKGVSGYNEWKNVFDEAVEFKTTPSNYSVYGGIFSMTGAHGVSMYWESPRNSLSQVVDYYQKLAWYRDVIAD